MKYYSKFCTEHDGGINFLQNFHNLTEFLMFFFKNSKKKILTGR